MPLPAGASLTSEQRAALITLLFLLVVILTYSLTLDSVPGIHCDEPWFAQRALSWLSTGRISYPAFPLFYAGMGSIAPAAEAAHVWLISAFGYNLFAIRLLSLTAFLASIWFWYRVVRVYSSRWGGAAFILLYSTQLLVFYAAHIGRFEMPIVCIFSIAIYFAVAWRPGASVQLRFGVVALIGTFSVFFHIPGLLVPAVAVVIGVIAQRLRPSQILPAAIAASVGYFVVLALYLSLIDLDTLRWQLFGKFRDVVEPDAASLQRFTAYLGEWTRQVLQGNWVIGPIYEGYVMTVVSLPWLVAGLWSRESRLGVAIFIAGGGLTLITLAVLGHRNEHYFVYLSPWFAGALAIAIAGKIQAHRVWRFAAVLTLCWFALRLMFYIFLAHRDGADQYQAHLKAAIPERAVVFSTIEHQMLLGSSNPVIAIEDLHMLWLGGQGPDIYDYFRSNKIAYVVLDEEARRTFKRPANQPFGELTLRYILSHGREVASIPAEYLQPVPGIAPLAPVGGVLGALHPVFLGKPQAITTKIIKVQEK